MVVVVQKLVGGKIRGQILVGGGPTRGNPKDTEIEPNFFLSERPTVPAFYRFCNRVTERGENKNNDDLLTSDRETYYGLWNFVIQGQMTGGHEQCRKLGRDKQEADDASPTILANPGREQFSR